MPRRRTLNWKGRYCFVFVIIGVAMIYSLFVTLLSIDKGHRSKGNLNGKNGNRSTYFRGLSRRRNIGGYAALSGYDTQKDTNVRSIREKHRPVKRAPPRKSVIDYGRDRDLDVEGVADYMMWYENFQREPNQLPLIARQQTCTKPIQNIAFLKTHFTGSDVVTNILNRNADLRSLHMALPVDGLSTFYWPMRFQWKYIDITMLNGSLPNIICNHARYNGDVMDNIMGPGTVYLTILRDPVTQLETTFNNLQFSQLLEIKNSTDPLRSFLSDPKSYIQGVIKKKRFKDSLNLIKNAMFFDLGLSTTEYHKRNIIKATIYELFERFSLILIYEYLDESLVLMKRRLCWELDDIIYLSYHHSVQDRRNRKSFDPELIDMIRNWNSADNQLYQYFNETLWTEIRYEGKGFWNEVKEFRAARNRIEADCIGFDIDDGEGSSYAMKTMQGVDGVELNPDVSNWNRYFCEKLLLNEASYLDYFRKKEDLARGRSKK